MTVPYVGMDISVFFLLSLTYQHTTHTTGIQRANLELSESEKHGVSLDNVKIMSYISTE
jgi:hypothetical protein